MVWKNNTITLYFKKEAIQAASLFYWLTFPNQLIHVSLAALSKFESILANPSTENQQEMFLPDFRKNLEILCQESKEQIQKNNSFEAQVCVSYRFFTEIKSQPLIQDTLKLSGATFT